MVAPASIWSDTLPRLLSVGDVAEVLGLSIYTVRPMARRGELKVARISGSLRFDPRDVKALIQRAFTTVSE